MQAVSGVRHAGDVLNLFTAATPEWGAAAAGRALGLSRSHAHRLLVTLSQIGLLDRVERTGRFRLGWEWFSRMTSVLESDRLFTKGAPVLRRFATTHDVRPVLSVWANGTIFGIQVTPEPSISYLHLRHCMAAGIVLMAGLSGDDLAKAAAEGAGVKGFPTAAGLGRCLNHVQSGGLLVRSESSSTDVRWLAAPVMDVDDRVAAAVALYVPEGMHTRFRNLSTDLGRAATAVTSALHPGLGKYRQFNETRTVVDILDL